MFPGNALTATRPRLNEVTSLPYTAHCGQEGNTLTERGSPPELTIGPTQIILSENGRGWILRQTLRQLPEEGREVGEVKDK